MKSRGRLFDILKSYRIFWIVCGGLFLVNVIVYVLFIGTASQKTGLLQSRFQSERKKVSEQRKYLAEINQFHEMQAAWLAFEESLPGKIQFPERVEQLKQILNRYRLVSEDLSFRSEQMKNDNLVRFATSFQATGQYSEFKSFIAELQAMPGLICIHRIDFRQAESDKPLIMDLELSTYFRDDNRTTQQ